MSTLRRLATRRNLCVRVLGQRRTFADEGASATPSRRSFRDAWKPVALASVSLAVGFGLGQAYRPAREPHDHPQHLPNGLPRTCCDAPEDRLTGAQTALPARLAQIVGPENVLDGRVATTATLPFLRGARLGQGRALCIVTPRFLQDVVDTVQAVVDADCVVLPQGQNTGLTGGSVPRNYSDDDRPVVVLSLKHLNRLFPIDDGQRLVCLAGTGLAQVQQFLAAEFPHRESHSTLGSTFLNPTTAAGVALGSGGTQVRKGPAYTERALYLRVHSNKWNEKIVDVVNTLGVEGMVDPTSERARKMDSVPSCLDRWSRWIDGGYERAMRYTDEMSPHGALPASDVAYGARLCTADSDKDRISRFNADTRGPAPNRSEGKVVVLATVHDTFPKPQATKSFWISTDSLETALAFRRQVCLDNATDLPVSVEYMDRDSYDVIDRAGRVLTKLIHVVGTASPVVKHFWNLKLWIEALSFDGAERLCDRLLYGVNGIVPSVLPAKVRDMGKRFDHHMALTVGEFGTGEMDRFLERMRAFQVQHGEVKIEAYECASPKEAASLSAFRFAAAPAFRTYCVGQNLQGLSVDYALPKDDGREPPLTENDDEEPIAPVKRMRYSHFACNVVHEDLAYAADVSVPAAKTALKHAVEHRCHGKLPAEHGHGTEYVAPVSAQERWKQMDPLNVCNPGVGGLSHKYQYKS